MKCQEALFTQITDRFWNYYCHIDLWIIHSLVRMWKENKKRKIQTAKMAPFFQSVIEDINLNTPLFPS